MSMRAFLSGVVILGVASGCGSSAEEGTSSDTSASALTTTRSVTVSSPTPKAQVTSPFTIKASCVGTADAIQTYMDEVAQTTVKGTSLSVTQTASVGTHQIEVKCWSGPSPVSSGVFSITVTAPPPADPFAIPSDAFTSFALDTCPLSKGTDPAYPGSVGTGSDPDPDKSICEGKYWEKWPDVKSDGTMDLTSPIDHVEEDGRQSADFTLAHDSYGDILNHLSLPYSNSNARHFVWDAFIKIENVDGLQVLEMGLNHSIVSGTVSFMGVQCNFQGDHKWDVNGIGPGVWTASNVPCDIGQWESTWHHVKLALHEDSNAVSTVDAIYDGPIDASGVEHGTTYLVGMQGSAQTFSYPAGLLTAKFQQGGGPNSVTSHQWLSNLRVSAW